MCCLLVFRVRDIGLDACSALFACSMLAIWLEIASCHTCLQILGGLWHGLRIRAPHRDPASPISPSLLTSWPLNGSRAECPHTLLRLPLEGCSVEVLLDCLFDALAVQVVILERSWTGALVLLERSQGPMAPTQTVPKRTHPELLEMSGTHKVSHSI